MGFLSNANFLLTRYDRNIWLGIIGGIITPIIIFAGLEVLSDGTILEANFNKLKHWYPCISVGYLCNRYNLFTYINKFTKKIPAVIVLLAGIIFCGIGRYLFTALDFIYGTILVYVFTNFMKQHRVKYMRKKMIMLFGKLSLNMWFVHCIFFSEITRKEFQPMIYWPKNDFLIFIVLIVELTIVSFFLNKVDIFLYEKCDALLFE